MTTLYTRLKIGAKQNGLAEPLGSKGSSSSSQWLSHGAAVVVVAVVVVALGKPLASCWWCAWLPRLLRVSVSALPSPHLLGWRALNR